MQAPLWVWLLSLMAVPLPYLAVENYAALERTRGSVLAALVYGTAVGAAASAIELRLLRRLSACLMVGGAGLLLSQVTDLAMILGVAVAAGLLAAAEFSAFPKEVGWEILLRRVFRGVIAAGLALVAVTVPFPAGGVPGAGLDITGAGRVFATVTYVPVVGLLLFDITARVLAESEERKFV